MTRPAVLTIAGSDSGGGAGIQADLKTFAAYDVHGASVITSVTAQDSRRVASVLTLPDAIVEAQIDAVMADLEPRVVKLGMLGNARLVRLVAAKLDEWKPETVVLDPVMIASSGDPLLEESAVEALRELLVPRSTIVTPNWDEAGALINAWPRGPQDIERIVISLQRFGARSILIKGGHLEGDPVVDTLYTEGRYIELRHPRIQDAEGHGTGCALASAIAAGLALGDSIEDSCRGAADFVHEALIARYATGRSRRVYLMLSPAKPASR